MEDLSRTLSELLKDPQTMEQIRNLTGMLGQGNAPAPQASTPSPAAPAPPETAPGNLPDPRLLSMFMKLAPMLQSANREDDSTRLLKALRPFMHEERAARIDGAIRLLGIMRMLPLLKGAGLSLF